MQKVTLFLPVLACLILLAACSNPATGPIYYPRIYIETYHPTEPITGADTETRITLYDGSGNQLGQAVQATAFAVLDYLGGLYSGTFYIEVDSGPGPFGNIGPYAIRVLSLNLGESLPGYISFGSTNDPDTYEDDDASVLNIPTSPVSISLGGALNRYLDSIADPDWMVLVLP